MKQQITKKQAEQFNRMLESLKRISRCQTTDQLRKSSHKTWGLDFEEALEMSYENIQGWAKATVKGVKPLQDQK